MNRLITELTTSEAIQLRKRWIDDKTVQRYVEALSSGAKFPPVIAFDDGDHLWLADGFHRLAAHRFLGLAEIEVEISDGSKQDAMLYAATANVTNGKPMSQAEKREAGKRLLKMTSWSDRKIARRLAVSRQAVQTWRTYLAKNGKIDTPATRTVTRDGTTYEMDISSIGNTQDEAPKQIVRDRIELGNDIVKCAVCDNLYDGSNIDHCPYCAYTLEERIEYLRSKGKPKLPPSVELLHGNFETLAADLASNSFDLIITDPPYGEDNVHLYGILAEQAKRLLKPGGSLLAMAGQLCIPDVLNLMTPHLTYHWTISYDTPGGQSPQIWTRKVNSFWKPVFWFVNGEYDGAWRGDKIKSDVNDNDKRFHKWGQSESGIGKLVSEFASVGTGKVLDPFVGGGTMAIVCYRLKIPFVGIDKDSEAIETTRQRILRESYDTNS